MSKWSIIPGETKFGQTMMFPNSAFRIPKPKPSDMRGTAYSLLPPFKPTGVGRPASGSSARLAREAELIAKRNAARTVPGSITRTPKRVPIQGPKPSGISRVDDLFGAGDKPLGFM